MSRKLEVATRKGLFSFDVDEDSSRVLRPRGREFLGDPVTAVVSLDAGRTLLVGLDHGHFGCKMHRSSDGGDTWTEIGVPSYPPRPDDADDINFITQEPIPWSLKLIWCLEDGGPEHPDRVWCGTIPGGLFRSDDRGDTWELIRALWDHPGRKKWMGGGADLPGIHSIAVDPRDDSTIVVGVSCGGVWRSEDDGRSWRQTAHGMRAAYLPPDQAMEPDTQDPHRIVQCPSRPDRMWAQHHNGIFLSDDAGQSWMEIEDVAPSTFGFAVVCDPKDGDRAWFIPALKDEKRHPVDGRFVVTHTEDGGRSFRTLTEGLPQTEAWDLVFRHAMDIDRSGRLMAFGSTTGSLWVGDTEQGRFDLVTPHLPPIYAVRFVGDEKD